MSLQFVLQCMRECRAATIICEYRRTALCLGTVACHVEVLDQLHRVCPNMVLGGTNRFRCVKEAENIA